MEICKNLIFGGAVCLFAFNLAKQHSSQYRILHAACNNTEVENLARPCKFAKKKRGQPVTEARCPDCGGKSIPKSKGRAKKRTNRVKKE